MFIRVINTTTEGIHKGTGGTGTKVSTNKLSSNPMLHCRSGLFYFYISS